MNLLRWRIPLADFAEIKKNLVYTAYDTVRLAKLKVQSRKSFRVRNANLKGPTLSVKLTHH